MCSFVWFSSIYSTNAPGLQFKPFDDFLTRSRADRGAAGCESYVRRVTVGLWILDAATHDGRWESTMHRAPLTQLVDTLVKDFPWLVSEAG